MIPLYREPFYTFSFEEDRRIDRFHLDGVPPGQRVVVEFGSERIPLTTGDGGWVEFPVPQIVHAGDTFRVLVEG
jgi:hypothetical protein